MPTFTNNIHDLDIIAALGAAAADDGDSILINKYADSYKQGGSTKADKVFVSVKCLAGWTGSIDSDNVFRFGCSGKVEAKSGSRKLCIGGQSSGATVWDTLEVAMAGPSTVEVFDVHIDDAKHASGSLIIRDSVDVDNLRVDGGGVSVMESSANPTLDSLVMNAGSVGLERDLGAGEVNGGVLAIDHPSVSPTTLTIRGGKVSVGACAGTIGTLNWDGGVLDLSRLSVALVITNSNVGDKRTCVYIPPVDPSLVTWGVKVVKGVTDPTV